MRKFLRVVVLVVVAVVMVVVVAVVVVVVVAVVWLLGTGVQIDDDHTGLTGYGAVSPGG